MKVSWDLNPPLYCSNRLNLKVVFYSVSVNGVVTGKHGYGCRQFVDLSGSEDMGRAQAPWNTRPAVLRLSPHMGLVGKTKDEGTTMRVSTENLVTVDSGPQPWKHKTQELFDLGTRCHLTKAAFSVMITGKQIIQVFLHVLFSKLEQLILKWWREKNNSFHVDFSTKMRRNRQRISAVF